MKSKIVVERWMIIGVLCGLMALAAYAELVKHEAKFYVAEDGVYGTGSADGLFLVDDSGTTGVQVLDGGQVKISNAYTLPAADGTADYVLKTDGAGAVSFADPGGLGTAVSAAAVIADHTLVRGDGGVRGVQDSGITIDDSDNLTNIANISGTGNFTISGSISAEGSTFKVAGTATSGGLHIQDMACDINTEGGDFDFRVQGDTDKSLFFLDAGNDRIGIGTVTPDAKLDVDGDILATSQTLVGGAANAAALLTLDQQADDDAPFMNFKGVVGSGKSIDLTGNGGHSGNDNVAAPLDNDWIYEGATKELINGEVMYRPYYSKK